MSQYNEIILNIIKAKYPNSNPKIEGNRIQMFDENNSGVSFSIDRLQEIAQYNGDLGNAIELLAGANEEIDKYAELTEADDTLLEAEKKYKAAIPHIGFLRSVEREIRENRSKDMDDEKIEEILKKSRPILFQPKHLKGTNLYGHLYLDTEKYRMSVSRETFERTKSNPMRLIHESVVRACEEVPPKRGELDFSGFKANIIAFDGGTTFETSPLLLIDIIKNLIIKDLGVDFYCILPERDLLMFVQYNSEIPRRNFEGILQAMTGKYFTESAYGVSPDLYKWDNGVFKTVTLQMDNYPNDGKH